jgi:hypothetical protein
MKYNKGLSPIVIIAIIVLVGGATYALVPRSVLKEYFEIGDKPTEEQFSDTIDSSLNLTDDGDLSGQKEYNPTKEYLPGDTEVKSQTIYQAKVLSEDQKEFKLDKAESVTFRWTPLVPKPAEPVTYRMKVWQLMQGQNGTQAMKSNQPIVTKDVDNITEVTVGNLYTGPCKPPYLCDFIWSVEVLTKDTTKDDTSTGAGTDTGASTGTSAN